MRRHKKPSIRLHPYGSWELSPRTKRQKRSSTFKAGRKSSRKQITPKSTSSPHFLQFWASPSDSESLACPSSSGGRPLLPIFVAFKNSNTAPLVLLWANNCPIVVIRDRFFFRSPGFVDVALRTFAQRRFCCSRNAGHFKNRCCLVCGMPLLQCQHLSVSIFFILFAR